ncbi:MAG: radical SAM protein [Crenarchaeota archaeon]|nr:radical SAM protein [Thermoproteota archaeon]
MRLQVVRRFDPWSSPLCTCPPKYSLQPYTGCSHYCLYCYATSYIGRRPSTPKKHLIERLRRDLRRLPEGSLIELSTSSDPYPPVEERLRLTRTCLELILGKGFRVLITTKGSLVARDAELLSRGSAAVMITITTMDSGLASRLEPGAPPPRDRVEALRRLAEAGVPVGVRLDPILPGLNDDEDSIREVLEAVREAGAVTVTCSTYKARPDNLRRVVDAFPELAERYRRLYREEGSWIHGYWYLPQRLRRIILERARRIALSLGLGFATCREGFSYMNTAGSCDGSHLIRAGLPRGLRGRRLDEWGGWGRGGSQA